MPALIRANFQHTWFSGAVESGPVKVVKPVMELTDHGGHGGHPVGFTLKQPFDSSEDFCVHEDRRRTVYLKG